jgi:hypothetical protein
MYKKSPVSGPYSSALRKINERISVWNKGHILPGQDPDFIRTDDFGNVISYSHYGNTASEFGWEIDRITTGSTAGSDDISNLRPLHLRCYRGKGSVSSFASGNSK